MDNEEYIREYIQSRQLKKTSYFVVRRALNHYSQYQQKTLHDLLIEADRDEEQGVRWKRRILKKRLTSYQNHLHNDLNTINSIKTYFKIVKAFYHHNEIEIGKLPPLNLKNIDMQKPVKATDLPDHDILQKAYELASPVMRALILFLSSGGMSKVDALNLTVGDFITATKEYHNKTDITEALQTLLEMDNVIPVWEARRSKTNKFFITFNTPEATTEIVLYLIGRGGELQKDEALFKINPVYYTQAFQELNSLLGLGKVGSYNRLRGHALRKFHATNLAKSGLDKYTINILQGKSNNAVDSVYFFEDEEHLKKLYLEHMDSLLLLTRIKTIDEYSPEYNKVLEENKRLKDKLDKVDELEKRVDNLLNVWD